MSEVGEPRDAEGCEPGCGEGGEQAFSERDRERRRDAALVAAERVCAERGLRFTPVRRRVLELLWESHRPAGAYALLDRLREEGLGSQPPTVYRALDFLVREGLAHKVKRLNAFVGCVHPENAHEPHFLICTECDRVGEMTAPAIDGAVAEAASAAGFRLSQAVLEVEGVCAPCAEREAAARERD